ncbi:MAG: inorganic phosphate transporter [Alphaproteobacteria bacterium]|nr:inorganic phosphate transporter [Alphaproteobacteria bacterium]
MGASSVVFLSSGLFLGWSLGANDAANIFGTAVSTRMVKFRTAAIVCSIFIALGAVISGVGAAYTLGSLGAINAIGGAFVTTFAAAFTVYSIIKFGLPVSVSQAVVGAIIGWNLFTDSVTDVNSIVRIASTWVACPLLSGTFAAILYMLFKYLLSFVKVHLLYRDACTRIAMVLTGAFGAYSLGANNMANVVGVFVPVAPFTDLSLGGFHISAVQQLFFVGALATAVGVFTYSYKVMGTVGKGLMPLSPFAAWVVVLAQSCVLFIFASEGLEFFLASHNLPVIPLVPVSATQAVVGAVIGIGLCKGAAKSIKWSVVVRIMCGWVITPVIAAVICFFALFFMQNVFDQRVYIPKTYLMSEKVFDRIVAEGFSASKLSSLKGERFDSGMEFIHAVENRVGKLSSDQQQKLLSTAENVKILIDADKIDNLDNNLFSAEELEQIRELSGQRFNYRWELQRALIRTGSNWEYRPATILNKQYNKMLLQKLTVIENNFVVRAEKKKTVSVSMD